MNNFLEWIKSNTRIVIITFLGLVIISAIIGFGVGVVKRQPSSESMVSIEQEQISIEEYVPDNREQLLFIPQPVVPQINGEKSEYSFYYNQKNLKLDDLELVPAKPSELIESKDFGIESDIKAFQFMGEELDILTEKEELFEP